jgi:hypothetical protein
MKSTLLLALLSLSLTLPAAETDPVDLGSRRELFVDRYLNGELKNTALK